MNVVALCPELTRTIVARSSSFIQLRLRTCSSCEGRNLNQLRLMPYITPTKSGHTMTNAQGHTRIVYRAY
eukprot:COSAG03_NODE_1783_length_3529_cov_1.786297_5_plen_70_part_00